MHEYYSSLAVLFASSLLKPLLCSLQLYFVNQCLTIICVAMQCWLTPLLLSPPTWM